MTVAAVWTGSAIVFAIAKAEEPIGDSANAEKVSGVISGAACSAGIMAISTKALLLVKQSAVVNSERMVDGFIMYILQKFCLSSLKDRVCEIVRMRGRAF